MSELYTKQIIINIKIDKKLTQYIFNTLCVSKQRELQLSSATENKFAYLFINFPLKMNRLINPLARHAKFRWCNTFRKHVAMSTSSTNEKLVLILDSVIENVDKCSDIFHNFFLLFPTLNFDISRNKIKNVLWRVCNIQCLISRLYQRQWNTPLFTVALIFLDVTVH